MITESGFLLKDGLMVSVSCVGVDIPFEGAIESVENNTFVFARVSDQEFPVMNPGTEVKVRVFVMGYGVKLYHGTIFGANPDKWQIGNVSDWDGWERREYFRQPVAVKGKVQQVFYSESNSKPEFSDRIECTVLDISATGLKISCPMGDFRQGDNLHISEVVFLESKAPFSFDCKVVRKSRNGISNFYGCKFAEMDEKEQDLLVHAIFLLQQKSRKK